jgi:hypothetical protein
MKPAEITAAHLGFGLLVAFTPYPELYDEAMSVLDEFSSPLSSFPIEEFKAAAIRALIAEARGHRELASSQAKTALAAAARTHSGYARHAKLGLVTKVQHDLEARLRGMAQHGA